MSEHVTNATGDDAQQPPGGTEIALSLPRLTGGRIDRATLGRWLAHGACLVVAMLGALHVSRQGAGLAGASVLIGIATAIPLYVAGRGWRLPWWLQLGAAALPTSVILIALADGGWTGAGRAGRYAWGALLLLALAAWATSPRRRLLAAAAAALLVLDQYTVAWFPWWGSGDPLTLMLGTFYWHNQFGVYCAAGAAVGVLLAVLARGAFSLLGGVVAVFAGTGVLASGSRADLVLLVVALIAAATLAFLARRWRGLLVWAVVVLGTWVVSRVMASSVLFPSATSAGSPLGGNPAGNAVQRGSLDGSWVARLDHWRVAVEMGAANPLSGVGLSHYGVMSVCYDRRWFTSNPHNEWLLGWAEGGLIGLIPLLAVAAGLIVLVIGALRSVNGGALRADPGRWAALLGLVVLMAHLAVDFDWAWPSLVAIAGVLGGVAAAAALRSARLHRDQPRRAAAIGGVALVILLISGAAGYLADPRPNDPLRPDWTHTDCSP